MTDKRKKEAAPCAASQNPQSPTPAAAPSQSPSPGTAPGACTGTIAPGGKTEPPGSKLYFKKSVSLVYRFSETGQFQFWLFSGKPEWKTSDFLNWTYARENKETLKPPSQWLAEYADSHEWPEITQKEFDEMCKNMNAPTAAAAATTAAPAAEPEETLTTSGSAEDAKTSQAWTSGAADAESSLVRHSLADTAPATQSLSDAGAAWLAAEPERPEFDYSALPENMAQHLRKLADRALRLHRNYYLDLMEIVVEAHRELCGTVVPVGDNGRFAPKDDTFRCWCSSVGINKTKAYQLLQIQYIMDNSTPSEQENLAELPFTTMREIAKTSTPPEILQAARQGDITNNKQYQEMMAQLDAEKARAEKAEAERDAARKEKAGLAADCNRLGKAASDAKRRAQTAEAQRDAALADVNGLSQQNTMLQSELKASEDSAAEKDARIRELEARPVEVVGATPADIARWRAEGAEQARRETQRELRRVSAEAAKERKRAEEAERDRDECADTMEKYATQLGELRGRQEMTDSQLHAIYTAEKAAETCTMVICQALDEICDLPRDLKAQAMEHLLNLCICLRKAVDLGYWPTEEDFEDEPDEWPEDDEDV